MEIEIVHVENFIYHYQCTIEVHIVKVIDAVPEAIAMNVDVLATTLDFARRCNEPDVRIGSVADYALVKGDKIPGANADVVVGLNINDYAAQEITIKDIESFSWV